MVTKALSATRFEIDKFNGKNDFSLWHVKMRALLVQQGLWKALKGKDALSATRFEIEKFNGKNDFSLWHVKMHSLLV